MELPGQWKAPSEDGQILIWPAVGEIQNHAIANQKLLNNAHQVRLNGVPLPEIRRWVRKWIDGPLDAPLFGDGHQVELFHAGVWAKNVLIDQLAKKMGGAAYQFCVETDAPKHLELRWPGKSCPLTDDEQLRSAQWTGLLDAPTPVHLEQIQKSLSDAADSWGFRPMAEEFLHILKRSTLEIPRLAPLLISALHELDWSLGLRHSAMATGPLWESEGWLLCVHHLAARAGEFVADYNAVLHEYRREKGIKNPGRPWPDLKVDGDDCELPMWLDCLQSGQRLRGSVRLRNEEAVLNCPSGDGFVFKRDALGWDAAGKLKSFLASHRLRISPRALTLTMFLRLIVCDQFVHGIGGAIYDEITDRLLRRRLKIDPPAFCVSTATLLFPTAVKRQRMDLARLLAEGRRLRHGTGDARKMELVRQIEQTPRRSLERSRLFFQMHARLAELQRGEAHQTWERNVERARQRAVEETDLFDRELFYALQPRERLISLIEQYQAFFR